MPNRIAIKKEVLEWVFNKIENNREAVAKKIKVEVKTLESWLSGDKKPTVNQVKKMAKCAGEPFPLLLLDQPPEDQEPPIPDFRTIENQPPPPIDGDLLQLIYDIQRKQDWFREYLIREGEECNALMGRLDYPCDMADLVKDIRNQLCLDQEPIQKVSDVDHYFKNWSERLEDHGILVLKSGIVNGNTHKPLDFESFRGFAIFDLYAPVIFINGKDTSHATIFTLIHELVHLWLGKSGISNPGLNIHGSHQQQLEQFCNQAAAEILVPKEKLVTSWNKQKSLEENVLELNKELHVSTLVLARKAADCELTSWENHLSYFRDFMARYRAMQKKKKSGGSYYNSVTVANSRRFTATLIAQAMESRVLLRDAGRLLNVSPRNVVKLSEKIFT